VLAHVLQIWLLALVHVSLLQWVICVHPLHWMSDVGAQATVWYSPAGQLAVQATQVLPLK
jgi:hypothetical protein